MTYRWLTEYRYWGPKYVAASASINWDSAAGRFLSNSSTPVTNSAGNVIGETLHVDVTKLASGAEILSYNCTSSFRFNLPDRHNQTLDGIPAPNNVSWTCVSEPVFTWCMYFSHHFGYFREWSYRPQKKSKLCMSIQLGLKIICWQFSCFRMW